MGLIKLAVFGFVALTVIYWTVWLYARSVRRERLEKEWDAEHPDGDAAAREAHIENGMTEYHTSLRPKLLLLIYVVPVALVVAALIVTNWN